MAPSNSVPKQTKVFYVSIMIRGHSGHKLNTAHIFKYMQLQKCVKWINTCAEYQWFLPLPVLTVAGLKAFHIIVSQMFVAINNEIPDPRPYPFCSNSSNSNTIRPATNNWNAKPETSCKIWWNIYYNNLLLRQCIKICETNLQLSILGWVLCCSNALW